MHFGVILGKPMPYWLNDAERFFAEAIKRVAKDHGLTLVPKPDTHVWQSDPVLPGHRSPHFQTDGDTGDLVRFVGDGRGDLFATHDSTGRHIGEIQNASWVYVPPGFVYYQLVCVPGASGPLTCQGFAIPEFG